jgi:Ca2+-binding RTX toxin-like protein
MLLVSRVHGKTADREDIEMENTNNRQVITLSALLMALVVLLSAVGLDDAEAKKKKKKKNRRPPAPALVVVQCAQQGVDCTGTPGNDLLVGTGEYERINGNEGNDVYDGKGGCDALDDTSSTSSDYYLVSVEDFCNVGISSLSIQDNGGGSDTLDLSRFYESTDFEFSEAYIHLYMDGPGVNDVSIYDFFTTDSVDVFRFSDKTLTTQQVKEMSIQE